jgi:molecular chaperone GrpE (heat shock protein)
MTQNLNRAELERLARLFRQFASETRNHDFRAKFLATAEELERALEAAPDDKEDKKPR